MTNKEISDDNIDYINQYIKLRGPDNTNICRVKDFLFVHNLLSITGEFTIQPFLDNNIVAVFNGEIYNFQQFGNYDSDGKCIIPLYKKYGKDFPKYLDGEFAIVLLDFQTNELIFTTDIFATKPLWYALDNNNKIGVSIYESPLKRMNFYHTHKCPANTITVFDLNTNQIKYHDRVYKFDLNQYKKDFADWNKAFSESIRKRSKLNIREGIFIGMSSGYDSGAIACEMNRLNAKFSVYTLRNYENTDILKKRFDIIKDNAIINLLDYFTHHSPYYAEIKNYIIQNVEQYLYKIYSSYSDYNEFKLSIHDDNGSVGLSTICHLARKHNKKIYLSGQGSDEIFSDYGFQGIKKYPHSNFGGLFPKDLKSIFPWASFYGSSQESYLMKEEAVAGSYGLEARYPYLDKQVVQEFLWLDNDLKNKWYKSVLHNYFIQNNFPFEEGRKIGF